MSLVLNTTSDPFQSFRTTLDGVVYTIELAWNSRAERWAISIFDEEELPILLGVRLLTGWPIGTYQKEKRRLPPGVLLVVSTLADVAPPRLDDFGPGKRCELTYYPIAGDV